MPTNSTRRPGAMTSAMPLSLAARRSALLGRADDVPAGFLVGFELDEITLFRILEEVRESLVAVVGLVEAWVPALERLLDHRAPDLFLRAALRHEGFERADHEVDPFLALVLARRRCLAPLLHGAALLLLLAHQVVVEDELIAVADEEIGARVLHAHADHRLRVLAELGDERGKIRVAADDHECIDMTLGVAEIKRIDDHAD